MKQVQDASCKQKTPCNDRLRSEEESHTSGLGSPTPLGGRRTSTITALPQRRSLSLSPCCARSEARIRGEGGRAVPGHLPVLSALPQARGRTGSSTLCYGEWEVGGESCSVFFELEDLVRVKQLEALFAQGFGSDVLTPKQGNRCRNPVQRCEHYYINRTPNAPFSPQTLTRRRFSI